MKAGAGNDGSIHNDTCVYIHLYMPFLFINKKLVLFVTIIKLHAVLLNVDLLQT
jgi:hypothetical protein